MQRLVLRPYPFHSSVSAQQLTFQRDALVAIVGDDDSLTNAVVETWRQRLVAVRRFDWSAAAPMASAEPVGVLILIASTENQDVNRRAFQWLQAVGPSLRNSSDPNAAGLIAITRLGGDFGLLGNCANPLSAGLAGLVKTARREWPGVSCRIIDSADDVQSHRLVAEETTLFGPIEMGISANGRCELALHAIPQSAGPSPLPLIPNDLVVITGGARGVTAEAAMALARRFQPTLLLLGRSSLPDAEADWLRPLTTANEIKKALLDQATRPMTPRQVGDEYHRVITNREITSNLQRLRAAGARVDYRAVDIRKQQQLQDVINEARQKYGPVRGILHGAGVLADRRIEDKTLEQFDSVYQTKVQGVQSLLAVIGADDLRFLAMYSSSTARFGRTGQCDYAAANEVLNALARKLAHERPTCRVVSANWGPWEGGMVTPGLRSLFAAEGVGLIPLVEGGQFLVDELHSTDRSTDVVVLGPAPEKQSLELTSATHPWLTDHQLNGQPVLPLAVMIEAMAQTVRPYLGSDQLSLEKIRVIRPITMNSANMLNVQVEFDRDRRSLVLESSGLPSRPMVTARLGSADSAMPLEIRQAETVPFPQTVAEAYKQVLFHGPAFRCITAISGTSSTGIRLQAQCSPRHCRWWKELAPADRCTDPLVVDAALQAMILWAWAERGELSIPVAIGKYRQYSGSFPVGTFVIDVGVASATEQMFRASARILDSAGNVIAELDDCEYVMTPDLIRAFGKGSALPVGAA